MSLAPGARVGTYEIVGPIGAGGMGEVYRARDTRLHRDVAIKLLPDAFAKDPERLARFEREARTLAALNHPNIAQIYGVIDEPPALVMEFVPGKTLDEMIPAFDGLSAAGRGAGAPGDSGLDDAFSVARAIAEALEAAHEAGIIHRDLKPANVIVRDDGVVKVLDFGLAKDATTEARVGEATTLTSPAMTQQGVILGTAAYMSPEQARGKVVDKRADVWAFGAVLYEMLTGRRLFDGETTSDVIAAVLTRPIDFAALPAGIPPRVRELVARCLERDPKRRLRDIGEARIALDTASLAVGSGSIAPASLAPASSTVIAPPYHARSLPFWALVPIAAVMAGLYFVPKYLQGSNASTAAGAPAARMRLEIGPPHNSDFLVASNIGSIAISPDGTMVAFAAQTPDGSRLFVRSLATGDTRVLPGIADSQYPFWSPDSRKLGVFVDTKLMTIAIAGGLPEAIATAANARGGAWTENGVILFSPVGGGTIHRVGDTGGAVENVTTLDAARGENAHYWPVALPGGRKFLFFIRSTVAENNGIYLGAVDGTTKPVRVLTSLSSGLYAPPVAHEQGRLLWVRDTELLSQAFDPETGALSGDVMSVAKDVRVDESQRGLFGSVSNTGTLAWASARAADYQLISYDRSGRQLGVLPIPPGKLLAPELSPNGRMLAFTQATGGSADVLQLDLDSGAIRPISTSPDYDEQARWAPDNRRVVHLGRVDGTVSLLLATTDGSAPPVVLANPRGISLGSFLPDGSAVIAAYESSKVGLIRLSNPGVIELLFTDPGTLQFTSVSPDGRWIGYSSVRSGRLEIYLAPITNQGGKVTVGTQRVQLSSGAALGPLWRRDAKEVVYVTVDGRVMSVTVATSGHVVALGKPTRLFSIPQVGNTPSVPVTASADLTKFIVTEAPEAPGQRFQILTSWRGSRHDAGHDRFRSILLELDDHGHEVVDWCAVQARRLEAPLHRGFDCRVLEVREASHERREERFAFGVAEYLNRDPGTRRMRRSGRQLALDLLRRVSLVVLRNEGPVCRIAAAGFLIVHGDLPVLEHPRCVVACGECLGR